MHNGEHNCVCTHAYMLSQVHHYDLTHVHSHVHMHGLTHVYILKYDNTHMHTDVFTHTHTLDTQAPVIFGFLFIGKTILFSRSTFTQREWASFSFYC